MGKILLFASAGLFIFQNSHAQEYRQIREGFYGQISPFGFGVTTGENNAPLLPLQIGAGFDFTQKLATELNFGFGIFWKPYDASTIELMWNGVYYPWSHRRWAPFVSLGIGTAKFENHLNNTSYSQFLANAGAGMTWFFGEVHGIIFKVRDCYHSSDDAGNNFNLVEASIFYRLLF